jgi:serine/threonine protein kinase
MRLEAGTRIGAFEILELIGSGGMGAVNLARDEKLGRTAALKVLLPELSSDPERIGRFVQEARAASAIKHANVAQISLTPRARVASAHRAN